MAKVTPSRQQYLDIKAQHPDCILFFRLGDFYETFDEDAALCARELDLVLTKRHENPMAGVPYHAADNYIAQLIEKGYKVAVAEQVGDPEGRGLMERKVMRVVTAGTVTDPEMLDARRNNYLVALLLDEAHERAGIAYLDLTTGDFAVTQVGGRTWRQQADEEIERLAPAEIIEPIREEAIGPAGSKKSKVDERGFRRTPYEAYHWELGRARRTLMDHFEVATLEGFGLAEMPYAVRAAGAALDYALQTQRNALPHLDRLVAYSTRGFMMLDAATRRNLELTEAMRGGVKHSLLGVLDETVTAMGARLLRQWVGQPLLHRAVLEARQDAVDAFVSQTVIRLELQAALKEIADLERLTNRVISGSAQPRDLGAIRHSLALIPQIQLILAGLLRSGLDNPPEPLHPDDLDPCEHLVALLNEGLVEAPPAVQSKSGFIRPSFSEELQSVIDGARHARDWIAGLQATERERTGISSLKVSYNKVHGYYIEVSKANTALVPSDYERRQTLVNAERYVTTDLKEYESKVLNAEEHQLDLEQRIFAQIVQQVAAEGGRLLKVAQALAHLDLFVALAEVAVRHRYVRPTLRDDQAIHIVRGRHPVVELTLKDEPYIPNDTTFTDESRIHIITGGNMTGKSTYMRQVALIVLMAQIGSFVPADEAQIGMVDRIFTRVGAQDEIARGQSTFMVEMVETANLLSQGSQRSLFILDEVGRGTSTYDGLAIARATVEFIHNHPKLQSRTLFATHYHELTALEGLLPRVMNYRVAVAEEGDRIIFLHRVEPGGVDRSYGIYVAQIAGMPKPLISRAREILSDLERNGHAPPAPAAQPSLPLLDDPAPSEVELKLRELDVLSLTPIEALTLLFELKQLAGSDSDEGEN
ncbi:MAG: DNA mismatch repair protein MutS [Anaerolineales bacterium]|nr:DNA mismatch repair protein MutS [Anaerolineales bacterium]MCB9128190.1 DNA mismatch repair protein MutS [Ardenticatenales bacterium]